MVKILVATVLCFARFGFAVRPVEPPPSGNPAHAFKQVDSKASFLEESHIGYGDDDSGDEANWNPLQEKSAHLERTYDLLTEQRLKVQGAVSHEKLSLKKLETDLEMYRLMHKATVAQEEKLRHGQSESLLKMFHTMYEGSHAGAKALEGTTSKVDEEAPSPAVEVEAHDEEPEVAPEELSTAKPEVNEDDDMGSPEKDKIIRNVEQADSTGGTFTGSGMPVVDQEIDNKRDMNEVVSEIKESKSPHEHVTAHGSHTNETEVEVADQAEDEDLGMDIHSGEPDNNNTEEELEDTNKSEGNTMKADEEVNSSVFEVMAASHKKAHTVAHKAKEGHKSKHHELQNSHHAKETRAASHSKHHGKHDEHAHGSKQHRHGQ